MSTPEELPFNPRLPWHPEALPTHREIRPVPKLTERRIADARQHPIVQPRVGTVRDIEVWAEIGDPLPEEGWDDVLAKSVMNTKTPDRSAHFWLAVMLVMMLISAGGIVMLAVD